MIKIIKLLVLFALAVGIGFAPIITSQTAQAYTFTENNITQKIDKTIEFLDVLDGQNGNYTNIKADKIDKVSPWTVFSLARYLDLDFSNYHSHMESLIDRAYETQDKLDKNKSTVWHIFSLAMLASGYCPTNVQSKFKNNIDLIADGTYNRELTAPLNKQGKNGYIWALIALDSGNFYVPNTAQTTRIDMINKIVGNLENGVYDMSKNTEDVDMIAMSIVALASYYYSSLPELKYVKTAINQSIEALSKIQCDDGDFQNYGVNNLESTAWVINATLSVGINITEDVRFIKNGNTLLDGMEKYRLDSGSYAHSIGDSEQKIANGIATEQALYTLINLSRLISGERGVFDVLTDFTDAEKANIEKINNSLSGDLSALSDADIEEILAINRLIGEHNAKYIKNINHFLALDYFNDKQVFRDSTLLSGVNKSKCELNKTDIEKAEKLAIDKALIIACIIVSVALFFLIIFLMVRYKNKKYEK